MKTIDQLILTILFAMCIGCLNAPLFSEKQRELIAQESNTWVQIKKGSKANGLQKYTVQNINVWAVDVEKAIKKLLRRNTDSFLAVKKVDDDFWLQIA